MFQSKVVQTIIISAITGNISESANADVSIKKVRLSLFNKIVFDDVYISDQQKDTLLFIDKFSIDIDSLSLRKKKVNFISISIHHPKLYVEKIDSNNFNFSFLISGDSTTNNPWRIFSKRIEIENGEFRYTDPTVKKEVAELMKFKDIDLTIDRVKYISNNDLSFFLSKFDFASQNGFEIKKFYSDFQYKDSTLTVKNLICESLNSSVKIDSLSLELKNYFISNDFSEMALDLRLNQLYLGSKDVAFIFPEYSVEGLDINMAGHISGKVNEIRGKNIVATIGDITRLNCDFYMNGFPDLENTYVFLNVNESYANLNEFRNKDLPDQIKSIKDNIPDFLDKIGIFRYTGNFTGFKNDFVAYGTFITNLGTVHSDISFKPHDNMILKVEGHLKTTSLNIGSLFNLENLGKLTLSGKIDGTLQGSKYDLSINGLIDSIDFNHYNFQRVVLNGNLRNKLFDGTLAVNDPNLRMNYSGRLDLSPELPVFEFIAVVADANLFKLNISKDTASLISFGLDANFIGNNIDNLKGLIKLKDLKYRNNTDTLTLANVVINNVTSADTSLLSVKSDWIDGEISGNYNFMNIVSSLINFYRYYLPSSYSYNSVLEKDLNNFIFDLTIKKTDPFCRVFTPFISFKPPFNVVGYYKPQEKMASLETQIPCAGFSDRKVENVKIKLKANAETLDCKIKTDKVTLEKNMNVYNFSVESSGKDDKISATLSWNNFSENTYSGSIKSQISFIKNFSTFPEVVVDIEPSKIYYSDSLWFIDKTTVKIDSTSIKFDELNLHSISQGFIIDGIICEDEKSIATADIRNVNFNLVEKFLGNTGIKGTINGTARLKDAYKKFIIGLDLRINDLILSETYFGDVNFKCDWNNVSQKLATNISLIDKKQKVIDGTGFIDINNKKIDMDLEFINSPLTLLEATLPFLFYNVQGNVNGKVKVSGDISKLNFDGKLTPVSTAGLGVEVIKTTYFFSDPVFFHKDSIIFPSIGITDEYGNTGLVNGYITYKNSSDELAYYISINTQNICAMNTTSYDHERFYGTVFGSGTLLIAGKGSDVLLSGDFKTEKGTSINIPFEGTGSAEQYDFIEFNSSEKAVKEGISTYIPKTTGLKMNFDVEVTPEAKVQIIFNSQIGDILKAEGGGNIQVRMDKNYNLELYGNYEIEKGDYLFTLQNIFNKRFSINKGGTIKWMGNPYDAIVDVKAVYRVKTSLHDLFMGSNADVDMVRRLPVDCIIFLTDNLSHPTIDFKIELPTAEERIKEEVDQFIVTKEDINKQIISLLMLGRFFTPDFFAGKPAANTGVELVGTTASELLSNQLTNWLSQIVKDWDFGINYRPGNEISNDQVELALSTQILNDRVTIGGNIGNNTNPTVNNSGEIVGDFDLNIKLNDSGKLQFKAYNHSNDNLINDTSPYTQGMGFTYREEFNTLNELLKMYKDAVFNKDKRSKVKGDVKNEL